MKFAVFDVDGTLVKETLSFRLVEALTEKGLFSPADFDAILTVIDRYKRKEATWQERGDLVVRHWCAGFRGQKQASMVAEAERLFGGGLSDFREGAKELVQWFNGQGYYTVALSRALVEALKPCQRQLGLKKIIGTELEAMNGVYTGNLKVDLRPAAAKKELLEKLTQTEGLERAGSYAFGDTEHDAPMLELVETPVCLHPNDVLKALARQRNWKVCESVAEFLAALPK